MRTRKKIENSISNFDSFRSDYRDKILAEILLDIRDILQTSNQTTKTEVEE